MNGKATYQEQRTAELNEKLSGWYEVELETRWMVSNEKGNDYMVDKTFSGKTIATCGMEAYDKAVKSLRSMQYSFRHRGNIAYLQEWAAATSSGYTFKYLGIKTDDGYQG